METSGGISSAGFPGVILAGSSFLSSSLLFSVSARPLCLPTQAHGLKQPSLYSFLSLILPMNSTHRFTTHLRQCPKSICLKSSSYCL